MAGVKVEDHKRRITLEYMNAALQRSKKMPPIKDLLSERKPPSLAEIMARLGGPEEG